MQEAQSEALRIIIGGTPPPRSNLNLGASFGKLIRKTMPTRNNWMITRCNGHERLDSALTQGRLFVNVLSNKATPLNVDLGIRHLASACAVNMSGDPVRLVRRPHELCRDDGRFIGICFQRFGRTVLNQQGQQQVVNSGEIAVWHGRQTIDFQMPDRFHKFSLFVPFERFESLLPDAELYAGTHFKAGINLTRLLSSCLTTLADDVLTDEKQSGDTAMDVTLDMLGAALTKSRESSDTAPRTNLFERIRAFIEKRLDDADLSPAMIAGTHHISVRYLYLIFSERGVTVGGWIRSRRLAKCRIELMDPRKDRTITEIALKWGFSDVAHFSRSFKAAFGVSPNILRRTKTSIRGSLSPYLDV
jgi:AraC-like DNA-binding protein